MDEFTQIISNLGFPIAACAALFWKINKQDENHKAEIDSMSESMAKSNETMSKSLDNNTLVLQQISEKMSEGK